MSRLKNLTHPVCIARPLRPSAIFAAPKNPCTIIVEKNRLPSALKSARSKLFKAEIVLTLFSLLVLYFLRSYHWRYIIKAFLLLVVLCEKSIMATARPSKGRPRRTDQTEAVKGLKLRQSTFVLSNQRKEALGLESITNSEFAEILLTQNLDAIRGETHHNLGGPACSVNRRYKVTSSPMRCHYISRNEKYISYTFFCFKNRHFRTTVAIDLNF